MTKQKPFRTGQQVTVYEDVLTCRCPEGIANIVSDEGPTGSIDVRRYRVRFFGESDTVLRNIRHDLTTGVERAT